MTTDSLSLPSMLMLGTLTRLVNHSLQLVEGSMEQLSEVSGTIVRLRIEKPDWVVYAKLDENGIQFYHHFDGQIDVRLRAPLGALLQYLLLPDGNPPDSIRLQGDAPLLGRLSGLLDYGSFWAVARGWLEHHAHFGDLMQLLGREDPSWLANLEGLPDEMELLRFDVAKQRLAQEDIFNELVDIKQQLNQTRRTDVTVLVAGILLLFASIATHVSIIPTVGLHQVAFLASLGGAFLLSRLFVTS